MAVLASRLPAGRRANSQKRRTFSREKVSGRHPSVTASAPACILPAMPTPESESKPTAAATSIARQLSEAVTADDADLLAAALTAVFDQLEPMFDRSKRDLDEGELRGWVGPLPVRLMVDYEGHFEVEARIDNMHWAAFEYDPELTPIVGDPDDPFGDSQDIRVFVAKGVYIQADPEAVDRAMQFVAGFEPAVIARISAALVELPVYKVQYGVEELFLYGASVHTHPDPVAALEACLTLVAELATALGGNPDRVLSQTRCEFCRSRYFFGVQRGACPNCGAPPGV